VFVLEKGEPMCPGHSDLQDMVNYLWKGTSTFCHSAFKASTCSSSDAPRLGTQALGVDNLVKSARHRGDSKARINPQGGKQDLE
jgi:hypothetical protein